MIVDSVIARPTRIQSSQRGSAAVCALLFATMLGGLAFALVQTGFASGRWHDRADDSLQALEAAETGIARAEQEISSQTDPDGDGVGSLSGTHAGSSFTVTATVDPLKPDRFRLVAWSQHSMSRRQLEVYVRMKPSSVWQQALFGRTSVSVMGSNAMADSYDSRLGSYASQATNVDWAGNNYAGSSSAYGSNGLVEVSGIAHGNVNAGPGMTPILAPNTVVTGDQTSLSQPLNLPPTPYSEFASANTLNNNGAWSATGATVVYNPITKALSVSGGGTLTLTGSTYFFSSITVSGNSTLKVTGPVKIYITQMGSLSGGVVVNTTGKAENLQFYQYPYALPVGLPLLKKGQNTMSIAGGADAAYMIYAPYTPVTVSGGASVFGAIIGNTVTSSGGAQFHYDEALSEIANGPPKLRRVYWRDVMQPKR